MERQTEPFAQGKTEQLATVLSRPGLYGERRDRV